MIFVPRGLLRLGRIAAFGVGAAAAAVPPALPPRVEAIREKLEALRAAGAIESADGRTTVSGAALSTADKLTLLRFLEETRNRAARLLGASFDGPDHALQFIVQAGEPEAPCQLHLRVERGASPPIRIAAVAPETLRASDLAVQACLALLRADALAQGYCDRADGDPRDARSAPYPGWFGAGVARLLEPERRQDDAESVLARWSRADLPDVTVLADAFSPYASADPALAAQLVAWLLDGPERGARYAALRRRLAEGIPWRAALFAEVAGCPPDPGAADARWDAWLLARRWAVLTPGVTTAGLVARTRDQLPVRPATLGPYLALFEAPDPIVPAVLLDLREAPWLPAAAAAKLSLLQRLGAGRGDAYRVMTETYAQYFLGLLRGTSGRRLVQVLEEADTHLRRLESAGFQGSFR